MSITEKAAFLIRKSDPKDLDQARTAHINYLKSGPPVLTESGGVYKIVHSLFIDREDLRTLWDYGTQGVRLYFGKETDDPADKELNIIAVPVKCDGENDVRSITHSGDPILVNTLAPCPDQCPPLVVASGQQTAYNQSFSTEDLNCRRIGTDFFWIKPNEHVSHDPIWFDKNGIEVSEPQPPFDE